jgi:hypothetical protein
MYCSQLYFFCYYSFAWIEEVKRIISFTLIGTFLETSAVWLAKSGEAALSFGAAQGVMVINLVLLTVLWTFILQKKKIAHVSLLIVIKSLFLLLSAWLVLEKIAPLPLWALGGFACFFGTLTVAGAIRKVNYEL